MEKLARLALNEALRQGAEYADLRFGEFVKESLMVKNGRTEKLERHEDRGFGLRVRVDGGWGFVSRPVRDERTVREAVEEALRIARSSSLVQPDRLPLGEAKPVTASYRTGMRIDPFSVPLRERIGLLREAEEALHIRPGVAVGAASMTLMKERKQFFSSIGSEADQEIVIVGAAVQAVATDGRDVQIRSWPNAFGGNFVQRGYEHILDLDLRGQAPRIAEEAVRLLEADPCPAGRRTLILHGSQLALQIHESCGHAVELDRMLGEEAGFVGKSFLTPDMPENFRYGSEWVNLVADSATPGAAGTFAVDDEGMPAMRVPIVEKGIFVGVLGGRDSSGRTTGRWAPAMRAVGWQNVPIVRMTNLHLEPGPMSRDELIASTEDGIYMEGIKSWSIDDRRHQFQFGCEIAWEIRDGKRVRMLKNPSYSGTTPEFWRSCDGVADDWTLWGFPNCGKGEPLQTIAVGHGAPTARFRNIRIGVDQE